MKTFLWLLLIGSACPQVYATSVADSAAGYDWKLNEASDQDAEAAPPGQCRGSYLQPESESRPGGAMSTSARSATHIENLSTTLVGDVEITKNAWQINSNLAWVDAVTGDYRVEGSVRIREPGLLVAGERAIGNLNNSSATLNAASFLIHEHRLRGQADSITLTADSRLLVNSGEFTTCEPGSNVWSIKSKSIEIKPAAGYGTARHVTLRIKGVPIAYTPYFRFPTNDKRQSGFLIPGAGSDSDGGTDIAVPWYFNLAPNYDATYTLRSMWKRGVLHEGDLRYLNQAGSFLISGAFLSNDDQYDNREQPGLTRPDAGFQKQNRWFTHVRHTGVVRGWVSRLNYTRVSDIDYLHDFGSYVGSAASFATGANSAPDSRQSPALLQTGSLAYYSRHWHGILELQDFQNLRQTQNEQYATLPRLTLNYAGQVSIFDVKSRFQLARYRKKNDALLIGAATADPIAGSRLVLDSEVSLPIRRPWGFFTAAVGIVHRSYGLTDYPADAPTTVRDDARITTRRVSLDTELVFERNTTLWGQEVYQTLGPRVYYLYVEDVFQDDLPSFDSVAITPSLSQLFQPRRFTGYDRVGDANQVALGLSTDISSARTGAQILNAGIGRIVYFKNRDVSLNAAPGIDRKASTSPLFASVGARFTPAFTAHISVEWVSLSGKDAGRTNRSYLSLKYRARNNAIFNLDYAYTRQSIQRNIYPGERFRNEAESDLSFIWPVTASWSVIGRWHYGLDKGQTLESLLGVEYNGCCWKARLVFHRYLDEPRSINIRSAAGVTARLDQRADSGIFFEFQLKGLTSLGSRLDPLLENAIPGYRGL